MIEFFDYLLWVMNHLIKPCMTILFGVMLPGMHLHVKTMRIL